MPLTSGRAERTVLTYIKVEFQGDWEFSGSDYSFRPVVPVGRAAWLLVVTEEPTGGLVTHWFSVRRRPDLGGGAFQPTDDVMVPDKTNIVYVPERCVRREAGDKTTCGPGKFTLPGGDEIKRQKRKRTRR